MSIRSDSYSSVAEVTAYVRPLLDGQSSFNSTTRPTLTELEKFIDRASAHLNVALSCSGFAPASVYANSTAKLTLDDWVTLRAAQYVELTHRGVGYDEEGSGRSLLLSMSEEAEKFIEQFAQGLVNLGIERSVRLSDGLIYTGLDAQDNRSDASDTSVEQPLFKRRMFENE